MNPVPVTVWGEGPLADWHRSVWSRHSSCQLLGNELPARDGMVDCCGPATVCGDALRACVRGRIPLILSNPTQWSHEELARLQAAGRRRKLPVVALGSLRLLPTVARLKEIASTGVLGELRTVRLTRSGTDLALTGSSPDPELSRWRDLDLCHWLAGDVASSECEATDGDQAERTVAVTGELGQAVAQFGVGGAPEFSVAIDGVSRSRRVPALGAAELHLAEMQVAIAARRDGYPWLLLPSLDDVVAADTSR